MGIFSKLSRWFSPASEPSWVYRVTVKCSRCGEIIHGRVDLRNDLSADYSADSREIIYYCRKGLIGEARCYQTVEIELKFNEDRRLVSREIHGGTFVDEK